MKTEKRTVEEEQKVEIKRVENGFTVKTLNAITGEVGEPNSYREETQVFETGNGDEDREMAEALSNAFWCAAEELWVTNSKHNNWVLKMGVKDSKTGERD